MKGYLNYLIKKIQSGSFTTGILMIITLVIYLLIFSIGIIKTNIIIGELSVVWLLIGTGICISWNSYWYDKQKDNSK